MVLIQKVVLAYYLTECKIAIFTNSLKLLKKFILDEIREKYYFLHNWRSIDIY